MARINSKITIRSVYFGMLLLSAVVMISAVRLAVADELDALDALKATPSREMLMRRSCWVSCMTMVAAFPKTIPRQRDGFARRAGKC